MCVSDVRDSVRAVNEDLSLKLWGAGIHRFAAMQASGVSQGLVTANGHHQGWQILRIKLKKYSPADKIGFNLRKKNISTLKIVSFLPYF